MKRVHDYVIRSEGREENFSTDLERIYQRLKDVPGLSLPDEFSRGRYTAAIGQKILTSTRYTSPQSADSIDELFSGNRLLLYLFKEYYWSKDLKSEEASSVDESRNFENDYAALLRGVSRNEYELDPSILIRNWGLSNICDSYICYYECSFKFFKNVFGKRNNRVKSERNKPKDFYSSRFYILRDRSVSYIYYDNVRSAFRQSGYNNNRFYGYV